MFPLTPQTSIARAALLAPLVLAFAILFAGQLHAQSVGPAEPTNQLTVLTKVKENIARWTRVTERVERQLKSEGISPGTLEQLRQTASELQSDLPDDRAPLAAEVQRIKSLIDALGPPPKEGEPAESSDITAQREQLHKRLADADGALKQLDLLLEKSKTVLAAISSAENIALGNKLLTPTPSLFSQDTWSKAAKNALASAGRAKRELTHWWTSSQVQQSAGSGFFAITSISVILAALLAWFLRRLLIDRYGRDSSILDPTYRMRVRAALAGATARTAIPIIVVLAAYGVLRAEGFLFDFANRVGIGIVLAVAVLSVLLGLSRSMLSPAMPAWRLAAMSDETAWRWYRYAVLLALLVSFDIIIALPGSSLAPSPDLTVVYGFFTGTAYALVFLFMAMDRRLWRVPDAETATTPADGKPARNRWWKLVRALIATFAVAVIFFALAGYGILSDFIARRMLATAGAFVVALILHGLARDLVAVFTNTSRTRARLGENVSPLYVWTVLFLDIGLILTMAFLIVPLWGGQWSSILDRFGWSLTGFKIGDKVFSLTDVLSGLIAFIFVIIVVRSFQHFLSRRVFQQMRMDSGVRDSLNTAIGYAGLVVAAVVAIATAGIDLSGLTIVAGALSVGIGFGLQSIVNNFVSGLILLAERPIKVGDWVQVGEYEGIVQRISVRSTEIKTFPRASVIVPNSELISNSVINWMHRDRSGRIELPIGVGYDSDADNVREILERCADEHENILKLPEPHVLFMDFGDNALHFELRCFVADVGSRLKTTSELRFAINTAFRDAGISIPYPQRDLHIRSAEGLGEALAEQKKQRARGSRNSRTQAKSPSRRNRRIDPDD